VRNALAPAIFSIDTAGERCCLALSRGNDVQTLLGRAGHTHLEHVLPMVDRLFVDAGVGPEHCDAFAFGSGPGSFTGLRVACTIAQGLAMATARPVIAVGNLLLLAAAAQASAQPAVAKDTRCRILAAADARMQQAYWAVYDVYDGAYSELAPPSLCEAGALPQLVSVWKPNFCAGEAAWMRPHLSSTAVPVCDVVVDGTVFARLAQDSFRRGELLLPEQAVPTYIRDRVALTVSERRASTRGAQL
jgi:tRNA threonylcarbamoyladenosine biosynthesis protein TsaB